MLPGDHLRSLKKLSSSSYPLCGTQEFYWQEGANFKKPSLVPYRTKEGGTGRGKSLLWFHVEMKVVFYVFDLHESRMQWCTGIRMSASTTTGSNSFRYGLFWYEIWGRYHVNKYREIYGIGMWRWTRSGTDSFRYHVNGPLHGACFPIRSWNLCCLLNGRVFEGRF